MATAVLVLYADDGGSVTVRITIVPQDPPGPVTPPAPPVIS